MDFGSEEGVLFLERARLARDGVSFSSALCALFSIYATPAPDSEELSKSILFSSFNSRLISPLALSPLQILLSKSDLFSGCFQTKVHSGHSFLQNANEFQVVEENLPQL